MKPSTQALIDRFRADRVKWPKRSFPAIRRLGATIMRVQRSCTPRHAVVESRIEAAEQRDPTERAA